MIYYFLYVFSLLPSLVSLLNRRALVSCSTCLAVLFTFVVAMRQSTGTDYNEYLDIWNFVPSITNGLQILTGYSNIEPGYKILISISKLITSDSWIFFSWNSILSVLLLFFGIKRLSRKREFNLCLSFFIFLCLFLIPYPINAMRQAITMSIFVFSIKDMIDKKIYHIYAYTVIAVLVHGTGIFILAAYFILRWRGRYSYVFIFILTLCLLLYLYNPLAYVVNFIYPGKYEYFKSVWGPVESYNAVVRLFLFVFLSLMCNSKRIVIESSSRELLLCLLCIYSLGVVLFFAFFDASMVASRINMFFRILEIIIIPLLVSSVSFYFRLVIVLVYVPIVTAYYYMATINPDNFYHFYRF